MSSKRALELIESEYPINIRSKFYPVIKNAYSAFWELVKREEMLFWKGGQNVYGDLINVAVEFFIKNLIDSDLYKYNYTYSIKENKRKNHYHLEIYTQSQKTKLTISQVDSPITRPRFATFRNRELSNQLMIKEIEDQIIIEEAPYNLLLTHGGNNYDLEFVMLGIPEDKPKGWIEQVDLSKEFAQYVTPEEFKLEEETLVALKEVIKNRGV